MTVVCIHCQKVISSDRTEPEYGLSFDLCDDCREELLNLASEQD